MKRTRRVPRGQDPRLQKAYKAEFASCEWAVHFPDLEQHIGRPIDFRRFMKPECNHIFGRSNGDDWSGLITLSKYRHDWFHANIVVGRVLCMLVKCEKKEADLEFWDHASGKRIVSWVDSLEDRFSGGHWAWSYWLRLVEQFQIMGVSG